MILTNGNSKDLYKDDWKGGTIGCGYNLLPNEHHLDCLKKMEKERKF